MADVPAVPQDPQIRPTPLDVKHCPLAPGARVATEFAPLPTSKDPAPHPEGIETPKVPLAVTGEPLAPKPDGRERPTLVTDPAEQFVQTSEVPFDAKHWPFDPAEDSPVPPFTTPSTPVMPPFPVAERFVAGISAPASARKAGAPAVPLAGPAKKVLAASVARPTVNVPDVVIGDPTKLKMEGSASPTLETVPNAGSAVGVQALAEELHSSTWPPAGALAETGWLCSPITVWLVEVPLRSPPSVSVLPDPHAVHTSVVPFDPKHWPLRPRDRLL